MTQSPVDNEAILKKVYTWVSENTQETRLSSDFNYYWPDAAKKLLAALELSQGSIIALVGLSGVGKSSAQSQIAKKLNEKGFKAVHFKWPGYFDANCDRILEFLKEQSITGSNEELTQEIIERALATRNPRALSAEIKQLLPEKSLTRSLTANELMISLKIEMKDHPDPMALARKLLGSQDFRSWRKELAMRLLSRCHSILLDLRDYGMKDVRAMNTDLGEIQNLWQRINEHLRSDTKAPNFVFVLQKELAFSEQARAANYFLGKARTFEITPFKPDDLIDAYKTEFGMSYPFDEQDLRYIARSSRGIFRRFLKYIQLCLELYIQRSGTSSHEYTTISSEIVKEALSEEEISRDWEIELRQLFPKGEYWKNALKVMNILSQAQEPFPQSEFYQFVPWMEMGEVSRMLGKLEKYGYVRRETSDNRKYIELNI